MEREELKPCPFCGGESIVVVPNDLAQCGADLGHPTLDVHYVHCDGCGADGPGANGEHEAVALWNSSEHTTLRAKLAEFKAGQDSYQQLYSQQVFENMQLRAKLAEAERDAARYRFACEPGEIRKPYICNFEGSTDFGDYVVFCNNDKSEIDSLIDAAMPSTSHNKEVG